MQSYQITVIAIFYNSENYCRKCIESIISQSYRNLQIVLVDDCSTDATKDILKEYASGDERIKLVLHQENKGISEARNSGLKVCTGDCFCFIDGDDYFSKPESLETLAKWYNNDLDYVSGSYESVNEYGEIVGKSILCNLRTAGRQEVQKFFSSIDFVYIHNRLINAKYKDYKFPPGKIHEDRFWNLSIYPHLCNIIQLDDVTYTYYARSSSFSSTSRFGEKFMLDAVELVEKMMLLGVEWKRYASVFGISLLKNMYLGNSDSEIRKFILTVFFEKHKLFPAEVNISNYPRFTRMIYWMSVHRFPDSIVKMFAKLYVVVSKFAGRKI